MSGEGENSAVRELPKLSKARRTDADTCTSQYVHIYSWCPARGRESRCGGGGDREGGNGDGYEEMKQGWVGWGESNALAGNRDLALCSPPGHQEVSKPARAEGALKNRFRHL